MLKDNGGFMRCYKKGRRVGCSWLCVYYFPNKMPFSRLGITAGKKLGGAVVRNRVKRIIRAAYRQSEQLLPIGYDIVFVGSNGIEEKKSSDVLHFIQTRLAAEMDKPFEKKTFDHKNQKKKK